MFIIDEKDKEYRFGNKKTHPVKGCGYIKSKRSGARKLYSVE